ncbi:hypothetical protein LEP1GSC040_1994 [Leptospira santarosai str. 2000030832]|nr:hypothetical protein LEP1GSC040_1994 [Leptospira santarosai str. 2000030832]
MRFLGIIWTQNDDFTQKFNFKRSLSLDFRSVLPFLGQLM